MARGQLHLLECRAVAESILADDMFDKSNSEVGVEAKVKPEIADILKMIDELEKDVTIDTAPLTTIGKSLIEGYTKALHHLRIELRKQFSV